MFCTHCGASNKDDAKLCINCNESLGDNPIQEKLSRLKVSNDLPHLKKVHFLHPLFDFSFNQFVTIKMVKVLYLLSMLSAGVMALSLIIAGFNASVGLGIFALLIGAPLIFFLIVISSRVFLEMILVVFRAADPKPERGAVNVKEKPESKDGIQWNV
jgi:heme A synthase